MGNPDDKERLHRRLVYALSGLAPRHVDDVDGRGYEVPAAFTIL